MVKQGCVIPLGPTLAEDVAAGVEVKLVGVGRHKLVKMTEAVPVDVGGGFHPHPIPHLFEAEDECGGRGVVDDDVAAALNREV